MIDTVIRSSSRVNPATLQGRTAACDELFAEEFVWRCGMFIAVKAERHRMQAEYIRAEIFLPFACVLEFTPKADSGKPFDFGSKRARAFFEKL